MTQNDINTIEDCVKLLISIGSIDVHDRPIMNSIYRQINKQIALTDRQYSMLKEKLEKYRSVVGDRFDVAVSSTEMPLRSIDRSKTVRIAEIPEQTSSWGVSNTSSLKDRVSVEIRFPFHKKTILKIEELVKQFHSSNYYHKSGSHSHYFVLNEKTVVPVVETFRERNFEIEDTVLEFYNAVKEIEQQPETVLPMFSNNNLINIKQSVRDRIPNDLIVNTVKLIDRRRRYGITNYGLDLQPSNLVEQIAFRETTDFLASPEKYSLQDIFDTIYDLDRYPMIIVLEERQAEDQLVEVYNELKNYIDTEQQSVLFRKDGYSDFNHFVKEKKLNNWVDNNTKVVYVSTNKLPKLLLSSDFSPITCFMFGSSANRYVDSYIQDRCDLIVFRDTDISPMRKYSSYYGNL